MNRKNDGQIRQWIDQSVFHHDAQETIAYMLWAKLETLDERKTVQNKASTIRRFVNLKYRETQSVFEHLSDFQRLVRQLTNMKMVLEDELQALLLLSSLPYKCSNIGHGKDNMFSEESRMKEQRMMSESDALVTEYHGISIHKKFHYYRKSRGKFKDNFTGISWTRKDIECYYYHEKGHMRENVRS